VLRLIVREGMKVGVVGVCLGVVAAAAMSRALSALVFGVSVLDVWTYSTVAATLLAVALSSCAIPAFRAARVDPMTALRLD
jgi:putative ABC transport system permease protein